MTPRSIAAVALAFSCSWSVAHAQTGAPVISLDMEGCPASEAAEVRRLLAIELEADVIGPASPRPDLSVVRVRCLGALYQLMVVSRQDPARVRERPLDLGSTGAKARPRFVALALVEIITTPEPVTAPEPTAAPPLGLRSAARERAPDAWGVSVLGAGRLVPRGGDPGWGGGVRVGWGVSARAEAAADVLAEQSRSPAGGGAVEVQALSLGLSLARRWVAGAGAARVGLGLRAGQAHVQGRASSGAAQVSDFRAGWGGPLVTAGATWGMGATWFLEVISEAGYAAVGVAGQADGRDVAGILGPWFAVAAGVGVRL